MIVTTSSELHDKQICYAGFADSVTAHLFRIGPKRSTALLKASVLLFDHVSITAAYFWANKNLSHSLSWMRPFLDSGDILPTINDSRDTPGIIDYFYERREKTDKTSVKKLPSALLRTIETDSDQPIASTLDSMGTRCHIDGPAVSRLFRKNLINDIVRTDNNTNSISTALSVIDDKKQRGIITLELLDFAKHSYLSRAGLTNLLSSIVSDWSLRKKLIRRIVHLYLLADATAINGYLVMPSRHVVDLKVDTLHAGSGRITLANLSLFISILSKLNIDTRMLLNASPSELIALKYTDEFQKFLSLYSLLSAHFDLDFSRFFA